MPTPLKASSRRVESRLLLERVFAILEAVQSERTPNCTRLGDILQVSRRTLLRDIEFMRDRLDIPIEYNTARGGYHLTRSLASFPAMHVRRVDLLALLVARRILAEFGNVGLDAELRRLFDRLANGQADWVTATWSSLERLVSVKVSGTTPVDPAMFRRISNAISDRIELGIVYRKAGATEPTNRIVRPYHLACVNAQWYVIALDTRLNEIRTFAVTPERLLKVRATKRNFEMPEGFSAPDLLATGFGVRYQEGGAERVVLVFAPELGTVIAERRWHPSQKLRRIKGGGVELTLRVAISRELINWVLSWGPLVRIIGPESLQKLVIRLLEETRALYPQGPRPRQKPPKPMSSKRNKNRPRDRARQTSKQRPADPGSRT